jgi:predicted 2-oxoglutarate/Fe(II)-dependent dioxygenase YbiX
MRNLTETSECLQNLYVERDFLSPALCNRMTLAMRGDAGHPATVVGEDGRDVVDNSRRRTYQVPVSSDDRLFVEQRLQSIKANLAQYFGFKLSELQTPQFLRYGRGCFFRPHQDSSKHPDHEQYIKSRRITVVTFLNQGTRLPKDGAYCGGELWLFKLDDDPDPTLSIIGEAGMLVAFPSDVLHEVRPITHGERFSVAAWYVDRVS